MSTLPAQATETTARSSLSFLQHLLDGYRPRDFAVRLWDGSRWDADAGTPARFTLVLQHPGAVRRMFWPPRPMSLYEAYINEDIDIEGDPEAFFYLVRYLYQGGVPKGSLERKSLQERLASFPDQGNPRHGPQVDKRAWVGEVHSADRDKETVVPHYNTSNEFYALWLDSRMVYTCAYFTSPDQDLETAEYQKLDYICRKLRLKPGMRMLDLGCGWGGLVIHAAQNYGVEALGVTITPGQAEWGNERIRKLGLTGRCRVHLGDYRECTREKNAYDRLTSVGFVEHVGESDLPELFRQAWDLLKPGGIYLNHGIVQRDCSPAPLAWDFVWKYVFPDTEALSVTTPLRIGENTGFDIRDVETLREHYVLTCRHWRLRLEARSEEAHRLVDEFTYRVFRLYLAASSYGFAVGQPSVYQSVFVKLDEGRAGLPLSRADWYT